MNGLYFDFETNDISVTAAGRFRTAQIDSQNCALISLSEICRLTFPEVGAQLGTKLQNRRLVNVSSDIAAARRQVEADGGTNVIIQITDNDNINFEATYED